MQIHLIWAQDEKGGIGKNNSLPWHISEDLQNFKKLTLNCPIIMGRKTWESLPFKPLPKRRNIVITTQQFENIESFQTPKSCIQTLNDDAVEKVFVIGGSMIYDAFFEFADVLHITSVHLYETDIDTYFPIKMDVIQQQFVKVSTSSLSPDATYTKWEKLV
jgi:dihydrofolate reductase